MSEVKESFPRSCISVRLGYNTNGKPLVALTVNTATIGLSYVYAKELAMNLLIQAERIEKEEQQENENEQSI